MPAHRVPRQYQTVLDARTPCPTSVPDCARCPQTVSQVSTRVRFELVLLAVHCVSSQYQTSLCAETPSLQ
eukprot:1762809-Rhodomonas_salina.1